MSFDDDFGDPFSGVVDELLGDGPSPSPAPAPSNVLPFPYQPGAPLPPGYYPNALDTQTSGPLAEEVFADPLKEMRPGSAVLDDTTVMPQIEDALTQRAPYRDPMVAQMERFAKAAQTDGGKSDEFYQHVEARKAEAQQTNNFAEQVGNPASIVGKRLGGNAIISPNINRNEQSILSWQAEDDSETGPVVVTLGLASLLTVENPAVSSLRPYAKVTWGSYGFSFTAEIDIGRGLQFCVNASSMQISVGLEADSADTTNSANLAAFISFKPCVRTAPVIRTRYLDNMQQGGGNAQTVSVPAFANQLLPVQMVDTAGQVQLDFIDTKNVIRYTLQISNGSQATPIPITGDICSVKVTLLSVTQTNVRLPFELSM